MPRPRTVDDPAVLDAAAAAISRVGPAQLTLTHVGREAGLSPATLLQRFGSKRGLLLALAQRAPTAVAEPFHGARVAHASPLAALSAALVQTAAVVASPEAMANSLAFLQIELSDPDFHRHALAHANAFRREVAGLLDAAIAAGELCPCTTERLARAVHTAYNGTLVTWAIDRDGELGDRLHEQLEMLLAPLRLRENPQT